MRKVFFSWQSDIPTYRAVISKALKQSIKKIENTEIDTATRDTIGAVEIDNKIFEKIKSCDVFVADLSIIGRAGTKKRNTPNPNVLYETGFALGHLGEGKLFLIAQKERNGSDNFPFDLRNRAIAFYDLKADGVEKVIAHDVENFFLRRLDISDRSEGLKTKIYVKDDGLVKWNNWSGLIPSFLANITVDNYSNDRPNFIENVLIKGTDSRGNPWSSTYFKIGNEGIGTRFKIEPHDKVDTIVLVNQLGNENPWPRPPMPDLDRDTVILEFILADDSVVSKKIKIMES